MRNHSRVIWIVAALALALGISPAAAAAKTPRGFFGVVPQEPPSAEDYSAMANARVGTSRTSFDWSGIQYTRGNCQAKAQIGVCDWGRMDALVASAANAGVRILPVLSGTPQFVSKRKPNKPPLRGRDLRVWRGFVEAAAQRYGRGGHFWRDAYSGRARPITTWQVWNEPNSRQFWSGHPNGRRYARLVKASAKSLRKGDRKADVTLGGMFADALVPLRPYMRQFYRAKRIKRFFDEIAIHPYAARMSQLKRQLRQARTAARRGGDRKVGLRVTELGWSSKGGKHPLMVGVKGQAKMLKKSFRLLRRKRRGWNIAGVSWFALRDTRNPDTCRFCRDAGLLNVSGGPKPAWRAFVKFSR